MVARMDNHHLKPTPKDDLTLRIMLTIALTFVVPGVAILTVASFLPGAVLSWIISKCIPKRR